MDKKRIKKIAVRIWLILLPFQFAAAFFTYETIGAVTSAFVVIMTICFNIIVLAIFFDWFYLGIFCLLVSLSYGVILVGYQAQLGIRLYFLNLETGRIVEWAYSEREKTGDFPEDLSNYVFSFPSYQKYIQGYRSVDKDHLEVYYYVGTPNTSHYYDTGRGGWGYYPD